MNLKTQAKLVIERAHELASCTETPGMLTRTFLSQAMMNAHKKVREYMEQAGLSVRIDAIGNIIGRLPGSTNSIFLTGSHLDTVPDAGKYDGMLGVLVAIASAELLKKEKLPFNFDIIGFSDEEGVRFKKPYLGSLAISGLFNSALLEKVDQNGKSLREAIIEFNLNPEEINQARYDFSKVIGFAEVHIEQGPVLENAGLQLGAVTGLVGQSRLKMKYTGLASHAGTTPMALRKDAFTALSQLSVFTEEYASTIENLVATIGMVQVKPGGSNVIPGQVYFSLDIRHGVQQTLEQATEVILSQARKIANERALAFEIETRESQEVVACSAELVTAMSNSLKECGHKPFMLSSGAGHDTAILSKVTPTAMLFVRSPGGLSHNPAETVLETDVEAAIEVFTHFLGNLLR